MALTAQFLIRVSPEEKAAWKEHAAAKGLSVGAWLRLLAERDAAPATQEDEPRESLTPQAERHARTDSPADARRDPARRARPDKQPAAEQSRLPLVGGGGGELAGDAADAAQALSAILARMAVRTVTPDPKPSQRKSTLPPAFRRRP